MQQSRVGQKLSDIITLRVVIGILALLLIVPSFNISSNLYGTPSDLVDGGLAMLTVSYTAVQPRLLLQALKCIAFPRSAAVHAQPPPCVSAVEYPGLGWLLWLSWAGSKSTGEMP